MPKTRKRDASTAKLEDNTEKGRSYTNQSKEDSDNNENEEVSDIEENVKYIKVSSDTKEFSVLYKRTGTLEYEWENIPSCCVNGSTPDTVFPWYNEILPEKPNARVGENLTYTNIASLREFVEDMRKDIFALYEEALNQKDSSLCVAEDVQITENEASYVYYMIQHMYWTLRYTTDRYGGGEVKDDPEFSYRSLKYTESKLDPSNLFEENLLPNLIIYRRVKYLLLPDDERENEKNDWKEFLIRYKKINFDTDTIERMLHRDFYSCVPDYFIKNIIHYKSLYDNRIRDYKSLYLMTISKAQLYEYVVCDVWYNEPIHVTDGSRDI